MERLVLPSMEGMKPHRASRPVCDGERTLPLESLMVAQGERWRRG